MVGGAHGIDTDSFCKAAEGPGRGVNGDFGLNSFKRLMVWRELHCAYSELSDNLGFECRKGFFAFVFVQKYPYGSDAGIISFQA